MCNSYQNMRWFYNKLFEMVCGNFLSSNFDDATPQRTYPVSYRDDLKSAQSLLQKLGYIWYHRLSLAYKISS